MPRPRRRQKSTKSASKRFTGIFNNVPSYVQRRIIEQALIPSLDSLSPQDAKCAMNSARKIARAAEKAPNVDLTAKKTELNGLLDELSKEARRRTSDNFDVLLSEIVDSIVDWLNDLWTIAVEHGFDFLGVHSSLLYSIGVLDHVQTLKPSGCRCAFQSIYAPIKIKNKKGKVLREFDELGLSNVETAIFWVWREVFVALFASDNPTYIRCVPESLTEIDDIVGWTGLERLILGGVTYEEYKEGLEERIEKRRDKESQRDLSECSDDGSSSSSWSLAEDQDDADEMFYEEHWTNAFVKRVRRFHHFVLKRMLEIFRASPSVSLYNSIRNISFTSRWALRETLNTAFELAPTSAVALSTALEIFSALERHDVIEHLLRLYSHLLRPRDSKAYQKAVDTLAISKERYKLDLAHCLAKQELLDTTHCIFHALKGPFASICTPAQCADLAKILRLPRMSEERRQRVKAWVNAAQTRTGENPMAIAAMMMGGIGFGMGVPMAIPVPIPENPPGAAFGGVNAAAGAVEGGGDAGEVGDGDGEAGEGGAVAGGLFAALNAALEDPVDQSAAFMNFDPNDPEYAAEYDDFREEYMPDLKGRFNGWLETLGSVAMLGEFATTVALKEQREQRSLCADGNGKGKARGGRDIEENGIDNEQRSRRFDELRGSSKKLEEALDKVNSQMLALMPWLRAPDIVEQLLRNMTNKPSKRHVVEALGVMHEFVKQHKNEHHDVKKRAAELVTKMMGLDGIVGATPGAMTRNGTSRERGNMANTEHAKPASFTADVDKGGWHPMVDGAEPFPPSSNNLISGSSRHPAGPSFEHVANHEHVPVKDDAAVEDEVTELSRTSGLRNGHELDQGQSISFGNVEFHDDDVPSDDAGGNGDDEPPPLEPVSGVGDVHRQLHSSRVLWQDTEEGGPVAIDGPRHLYGAAMENMGELD